MMLATRYRLKLVYANTITFGHTRQLSTSNVILSFKNVNFEYKQTNPLLKDVSFSIREGSKVTIMGQNGSGKSTILKLMAGTLSPDSGTVNSRFKILVICVYLDSIVS